MLGKEIGGKYRLRWATPRDASEIRPFLRPEDIHEWDASAEGGVDHLEAIIEFSTLAYTIETLSGFPEIVMGVQHSMMAVTGYTVVWMLGTDAIEKDGVWLFRAGYRMMIDTFNAWGPCECWTHVDNTVHHKWLEFMGFKCVSVGPWGWKGEMFKHYRREIG